RAPGARAGIRPGVVLMGAAFGLGFSSLDIRATAGVADHEQGLASGILQTSFQIGGAIVLAVVTAVIDARGANHVVSTHTLTAYRPALDVIAGVAVLGVAVALSGLRAPRPRPAGRATIAAGRAAVAASPPVAAEDDRGRPEPDPVRRYP